MALPGPLNRYLLLMAQEHLEFRLPEIKSLLSLFGGQFISNQGTYGKSPFWILSIPSEEIARNLMKRTVCAKTGTSLHICQTITLCYTKAITPSGRNISVG
uniref:tRNA methyltransferase 11 homolog n=2 Tax=Equus TaxID=9789 RepID=A0A9L0THU0_HORSE